MLFTTFPTSSLRPSSISFNTTMTSVLRGKQWPLVLELIMEMRQRTKQREGCLGVDGCGGDGCDGWDMSRGKLVL